MAEKLGSASSSSNKRMKKAGIDRLSELPDSILISILSLLSTREAIRTCVLSRRWLFLWTDLPELAFQDTSYENKKISKFVDWVYDCLLICGGNHLRRFEVSFYYKECFASNLDAWVRFALKHKVKDVALLLDCENDCENDYLLPQMMYSNSYLTCLSLQGCIMAPKNTIQWGALSSLCLKNVEFRGNVIEKILSSCPVLHDLTLQRCSHFSRLDCFHVKSQSLRELTIIGLDIRDFGYDNEFLEISAPLIHYARILVYFDERKLELTNVSSLVEADIDFERYIPDCVPKLISYTERLFKKLQHVKKLKVGPEFIRVLGDLVADEGLQLSQCRVECLQLNADIFEDTACGIVCLLESSPNLKALHISLCRYHFKDVLEKIELNRDLLHLKTVTITVHEKPELVAKTMLTVVRLLLKRAPVLEKLVIDFSLPPSGYYPPLEYMKIAQTLLSCPRASAEAVVELSPVTFSS